MKPYIVNYATRCKFKKEIKDISEMATRQTFTIENDDEDSFAIGKLHSSNNFGGTTITETIENIDPDEFAFFESTFETKRIETSDPDEFAII